MISGAFAAPRASKNRSSVAFARPGAADTSRSRVVVDDHGQVLLPALVGDLSDPDPSRPANRSCRAVDVGADPGDDRATVRQAIRIGSVSGGVGRAAWQPGDCRLSAASRCDVARPD